MAVKVRAQRNILSGQEGELFCQGFRNRKGHLNGALGEGANLGDVEGVKTGSAASGGSTDSGLQESGRDVWADVLSCHLSDS